MDRIEKQRVSVIRIERVCGRCITVGVLEEILRRVHVVIELPSFGFAGEQFACIFQHHVVERHRTVALSV